MFGRLAFRMSCRKELSNITCKLTMARKENGEPHFTFKSNIRNHLVEERGNDGMYRSVLLRMRGFTCHANAIGPVNSLAQCVLLYYDWLCTGIEINLL